MWLLLFVLLGLVVSLALAVRPTTRPPTANEVAPVARDIFSEAPAPADHRISYGPGEFHVNRVPAQASESKTKVTSVGTPE